MISERTETVLLVLALLLGLVACTAASSGYTTEAAIAVDRASVAEVL